ncbi:MAG: Wzz/FepE/Etk N-terminal domain-containing protein [Candidatus Eisenbacteria bacterium]|nr:Wzz/FepE/Etk N-terminal domain-containing protein [Candidatus Eisenbacteria bacterium]
MLEVPWRHRKLIFGVVAGFLLLSIVLSLVMPRAYVARTSLLPPVSSSAGGFSGTPGLEASLGLLGIRDESMSTAKLFQEILKSRTVMEAVIRKQDLIDWWRIPHPAAPLAMEQAVALLRGATDVSVNDAGVIEISVRMDTGWFTSPSVDARTRAKAADTANDLVAELDAVNREKSLSRAKQTRIYLERQLDENNASIRRLGETVAGFQRQHGAVALDVQTKVLIEGSAKLKSDLMAKEVDLGIARQSMTPDNPVVTNLENEIAQLREAIAKMEGSRPGSSDPATSLATSSIPDLALQLADYERELQAQLLLQTYLNQQYYQAKIQEARDTPTVQVLDTAVPPEERFSPKRKLMVVAGLLSGALVALLAAALVESPLPEEIARLRRSSRREDGGQGRAEARRG